jgi:hypothetical protein
MKGQMSIFLSTFFTIAFLPALVLCIPAWAGEAILKSNEKPRQDVITQSGETLRFIEKGKNANRQKLPTADRPGWVEPNTDRPGWDYKNFWVSGGPEECQKACAKDPKCKAYTYVKPRKKGDRARCWIKYKVPAPVTNNCCISGVKTMPKADKVAYPRTVKEPGVVKFPEKQKVDTTIVKDQKSRPQKFPPPQKPQPDLRRPLPPEGTGEPQEYTEGSYVYREDYEEKPQQYSDEGYVYREDYQEKPQPYPGEGYVYREGDEAYPEGTVYEEYPEEKRDILEELGMKVWKGPQEQPMPPGGMPPGGMPPQMPAEEKPYAGGVLSSLMGGKPELLITDIEMRNPNKKGLIIHRDLRSRDWVFEVKVVNTGKTQVSNVGILVAVGNERLNTIIEDTIEYNKGAIALVYVRPSGRILSGKSVEINAVVDPENQYKENNEENNLFTKTFKLRSH